VVREERQAREVAEVLAVRVAPSEVPAPQAASVERVAAQAPAASQHKAPALFRVRHSQRATSALSPELRKSAARAEAVVPRQQLSQASLPLLEQEAPEVVAPLHTQAAL
jgi:hypothetical protein